MMTQHPPVTAKGQRRIVKHVAITLGAAIDDGGVLPAGQFRDRLRKWTVARFARRTQPRPDVVTALEKLGQDHEVRRRRSQFLKPGLQPFQPRRRGRDVFALMLVGARHDEAVDAVGAQAVPQAGDPGRALGSSADNR